MSTVPDTLIVTGPNFEQDPIDLALVTPTGGVQMKLRDALAFGGNLSMPPPIGNVIPNTAAFTTVSLSGALTGTTGLLKNTTDTSYLSFGPVGLAVTTDGNQSTILGYIYNGLPPNSPNLGAAVNGYGKMNCAGGAAFGMYALGELYAPNGTVVGQEITARNFSGSPDVNLPPNEGIGTPTRVSNGLQITSGGTFDSSIGLLIGSEGGSTKKFNTSAYIHDYIQYGLFIDAAPGTPTTAVLQNNGGGINLQLGTTGTMAPNNAVFTVVDNVGASHMSVRQNGDVYANGVNAAADSTLAALSATSVVSTGVLGSSGNMGGVYPPAGWNVAIGWNFTGSAAEADWINGNNAGGGHTFWQRTGTATSTRLVDISATGALRAYGEASGASIRTLSPSGPTWTAGTGAPATTQPLGSMFSRTDGGVGTTLYVSRGAGTWNPVAGV